MKEKDISPETKEEVLVIPPGFTYSCLGIETNVHSSLSEPVILESGVLALFRAPFELEDFWIKEIGTARAEEFHKSNFFVMAMSNSAGGDDRLRRIATTYYYALLISGLAYSTHGLAVGGYSSAKETIRQSSLMPLDAFNRPFKVLTEAITNDSLMRCVKVAGALRRIFGETGSDYLRLRQGVNALLRGIMEGEVHIRLPHMLRSIEAIIRPSLDDLQADFLRRCKTFAGESGDDPTILNELYDLRLRADHIYPMRDAVLRYPAPKQESVIALRSFQAELLSSHILTNIITNDRILELFKTETSIVSFWRRVDEEGFDFSVSSIDLDKAAAGRFLDHL